MSTGDAAGFLEACKAGDDPVVSEMLARDPSLAAVHPQTGESPVVGGALPGPSADRRSLIAAGSPLDMFAAAALGRADIVERVVDADPDARPAVCTMDGRRCTWPRSSGADNGEECCSTGARTERAVQQQHPNTALHAAVAGGRVEAALTLIEAGAGSTRPTAAATRRCTSPPKVDTCRSSLRC